MQQKNDAKPMKAALRCARRRSQKKGIPFTITHDDLLPLPEFCPMLGVKLKYNPRGFRSGDTASIDRIYPPAGYVPGNVLVISYRANRIKSNATTEEVELLLAYMQKYYGYKRSYLTPMLNGEKPYRCAINPVY